MRREITMAAKIVALLLGSASLSTAQAQSDDAVKDDLREVEACLERVNERKGTPIACIGRMSARCMDRPGGSSTKGMRICTDRETEAWDQVLNRNYKKVRRQVPGAAAKKLQEIQRAWITWRNEKCGFGYTLFEGGTLAGVAVGQCVMKTTAIRAFELGELVGATRN